MSTAEGTTRRQIEAALAAIAQRPLADTALALFETLGYIVGGPVMRMHTLRGTVALILAIGFAWAGFVATDGVHWTKEDGVRLQAGADEQITDPFVIRWQGGWKMYFKTEQRTGRGAGPRSSAQGEAPTTANASRQP